MIRQAGVADTEPLLAGPDPRPGDVWLTLDADDAVGYAVVTWGYAIESGGAQFLESERANEDVRRCYGRHGFAVEDSIWMTRDL